MKVSVGVSAHHVHLTKETYDKLFDEPIEKIRDLDQPGQFAAKQTLIIKKNDRQIENVRIVGPLREYNQVEISKTDSFKLKTNPPIRTSGDVKNSESIELITPKGSVKLEEGLILANRHIHITPKQIKELKLENVEKVSVRIGGEKPGIMQNVFLKVQETASLRLHLDTDDANAFLLKDNDEVEFYKN